MITGSPGSGQQPSEHALFDLNAAAERTSLAWQRSGLGMVGVGALFIRGHALLSVLVGCVLVGTGILVTTMLGRGVTRRYWPASGRRDPPAAGG
jgi:uncharacterized membrane protein YidH (DUF202 family)